MLAIFRFANMDRGLRTQLSALAARWRGLEGCQSVELAGNVDDSRLWVLVSSWRDIGSYRRALSAVKLDFMPVLLQAIDEPSAYLGDREFEGAREFAPEALDFP